MVNKALSRANHIDRDNRSRTHRPRFGDVEVKVSRVLSLLCPHSYLTEIKDSLHAALSWFRPANFKTDWRNLVRMRSK